MTTRDKNEDGTVIIEEKIPKLNGDIAIKRYQKGRLLGKGGFAKCYEVTNLETRKVDAAKIIPKASLQKSRARQKLISEIKIHRALHHANVVKFHHVFEDNENVYILLEICPNQTLNDLLKRRKRLTELEVQFYLMQIIVSLKYLHANRVIHRDMKLGNLFLGEKLDMKLGDFGLATRLEFDGEKKRTICGTPNYIAPEILDGKVGHSYEVDIWSVGVIIYTLIIGKPPFETPDVKATYKKIKACAYCFPEHIPISEPARNLITKILVLDPTKRPNLDEILNHPFLNHSGGIPKELPLCTLACPPPANFTKQFASQGTQRISTNPVRIENPTTNTTSKTKIPLISETEKRLPKNEPGSPQNIKQTSTGKLEKYESSLSSKFLNRKAHNFLDKSKYEVYVKKWVDYSTKYGLGYLLTNGCTGVYFNDGTKIIFNPKLSYFEYMEKKSYEKQDVVSSYTFEDYPETLKKKVLLLQHFKTYLEQEVPNHDATEHPEESKEQPLVYVKKWMRTNHALLFRLSNKIVQINFVDKTELVLSSVNKTVTYMNKKGEKNTYPISSALDSTNAEMTKRLKYTKEILATMITLKAQVQGNEKPVQDYDEEVKLN